jgi:hypothetical protein
MKLLKESQSIYVTSDGPEQLSQGSEGRATGIFSPGRRGNVSLPHHYVLTGSGVF